MGEIEGSVFVCLYFVFPLSLYYANISCNPLSWGGGASQSSQEVA